MTNHAAPHGQIVEAAACASGPEDNCIWWWFLSYFREYKWRHKGIAGEVWMKETKWEYLLNVCKRTVPQKCPQGGAVGNSMTSLCLKWVVCTEIIRHYEAKDLEHYWSDKYSFILCLNICCCFPICRQLSIFVSKPFLFFFLLSPFSLWMVWMWLTVSLKICLFSFRLLCIDW